MRPFPLPLQTSVLRCRFIPACLLCTSQAKQLRISRLYVTGLRRDGGSQTPLLSPFSPSSPLSSPHSAVNDPEERSSTKDIRVFNDAPFSPLAAMRISILPTFASDNFFSCEELQEKGERISISGQKHY